jgi:ribosomal protein S18 acetylase RimI-like enzyme
MGRTGDSDASGADQAFALLRRIERAALLAWPPVALRDVAGWRLASGGVHTRRLRSARTLDFHGGADVEQAIDEVERHYARLGLPACFHITNLVAPPDLDARLAARGYARVTPTSVLLGPVPALQIDESVELLTRASQAVMNAISDRLWSEAARAERAATFARIRRPHRFALAWAAGEPAAAGLAVREGDLVGIFAMRTQPHLRRRGLAEKILARLAGWAAAEGARQLYLQVEDDNLPALGLYRKLGLTRSYGYHYREMSS